MATIIDFTSRKIVAKEPSTALELDWRFDVQKHSTAGKMVKIEIVAREDFADDLHNSFVQTWARMIRKECKSA